MAAGHVRPNRVQRGMELDVLIEDARWDAAGLEPLARAAFAAVAQRLLPAAEFEVSLMGCDDARIAGLNGDFRGKRVPTNVLSWPAAELSAEEPGGLPDAPEPGELGDIAIAYDTCQREAAEQNKPFDAHVSHLLVHGFLHLLGYDHISDEDAALMERLEVEILATLGIADPY